MKKSGRPAALLAALIAFAGALPCDAATSKPKVRAITAFVRVDQADYRREIGAAVEVLNSTKREFAAQGYETETLRGSSLRGWTIRRL